MHNAHDLRMSTISQDPAASAPQRLAGQCALKFCAAVLAGSGYGEFARGFVTQLNRLGVPLSLDILASGEMSPDRQHDRELFEKLRQQRTPYRAKIINFMPDIFPNQREKGCANIGFTMFETTRIPSHWVPLCNEMDGILVPSAWNRMVFEESGVTVPVRVAAPGIDLPNVGTCPHNALGQSLRCLSLLEKSPLKTTVPIKKRWFRKQSVPAIRWKPVHTAEFAHAYKFYSIFQWTERKNPRGLLEAYFAEFRKTDNVCLVLKTYGRDTNAEEQARIAGEICAIRDSMLLSDHAPVLLIGDLLSRDQIRLLHQACDCFVLPHRAEGFGMPHFEAMAHGNPVIATGYSGNREFMNDSNSILLPYQFRPAAGMGYDWHDLYEGDTMWAEPDLGALRQAMRNVVSDREFAAAIGQRAREHLRANFAWSSRMETFLHAVNEIIASTESRKAIKGTGFNGTDVATSAA